eukprot:1815345-Rhodomonas_salina.1
MLSRTKPDHERSPGLTCDELAVRRAALTELARVDGERQCREPRAAPQGLARPARNQTQETTTPVQFAPEMPPLVFDFARYPPTGHCVAQP